MTYLDQAKPIFLQGLSEQLNMQAGFRRDIELEALPHSAVVQVTARAFYRLYVNGTVVMNGPARTAHGYLRVDEVDVLPFLQIGTNAFAFELTTACGCLGGYSNDICAESSMLLAAIVADGNCIAATDDSWDAVHLSQRVEYSARISHCRENTEIYHLDTAYVAWRTQRITQPGISWEKAGICGEKPALLPREVPLPEMKIIKGARLIEAGSATIQPDIKVTIPWYEKMYADYYAKIAERPLYDYLRTVEDMEGCRPGNDSGIQTVHLSNGVACRNMKADETAFLHFDCGVSELGFIGFTVTCAQDGVVDVVHLETYGEYDDKRIAVGGTDPVTRLYVKKGTTDFLTMEPALFRYLKFYFRGTGDCAVTNIHVRTYHYPDMGGSGFQCSDDGVNRLYEAARRTLVLNSLDIFMDCPERERGGWLCDSFWTARAAALLLGDLSVEKAFLENFMLAPYGDGVGAPNNFFPEVYPGSKLAGAPTITTWSFWLMLELCEYVQRSGDMSFALQHVQRVRDFVTGTQKYLGKTGLLENMPNVFVDWSQANAAANTQPISTAANALYADMLLCLGELYHDSAWTESGREIRNILKAALLGTGKDDFMEKPWICDTLQTDERGRLIQGETYSEACQYTVLWSGLFEKQEIPQIYHSVIKTMGPAPQLPPSPMVGKANLFIGLCIRLDMLARFGEYDTLYREIRAIYDPQLSEGPGTLWETQSLDGNSRCHGFNSHVAVQLVRDMLGLDIPKVYDIQKRRSLSESETKKAMQLPAHLCGLRWMRGTVGAPFGIVSRRVEQPKAEL